MAKRNKVVLDERKVDDMVATVVAEKKATKEEKKASIFDLFSNRQLCLRTLNICFCWMVNSATYYGLALSASNLGGNPYYNYLIRFSHCQSRFVSMCCRKGSPEEKIRDYLRVFPKKGGRRGGSSQSQNFC